MRILSLVLAGMIFQGCSSEPHRAEGAEISQADASHSYAIGHIMARHYKKMEASLDVSAFGEGFADGFQSDFSESKDEEMLALANEWRASMEQMREQKKKALAQRNLQVAEQWLAQKRKQPGVTALDSGLVLETLVSGEGKRRPTENDQVVFSFESFRIDGARFDASEEQAPVTAEVSSLLPGLKEAVTHMVEGAKARLHIPAELAFGDAGFPGLLEPGEMHIVELTLEKIEAGSANNSAGHSH